MISPIGMRFALLQEAFAAEIAWVSPDDDPAPDPATAEAAPCPVEDMGAAVQGVPDRRDAAPVDLPPTQGPLPARDLGAGPSLAGLRAPAADRPAFAAALPSRRPAPISPAPPPPDALSNAAEPRAAEPPGRSPGKGPATPTPVADVPSARMTTPAAPNLVDVRDAPPSPPSSRASEGERLDVPAAEPSPAPASDRAAAGQVRESGRTGHDAAPEVPRGAALLASAPSSSVEFDAPEPSDQPPLQGDRRMPLLAELAAGATRASAAGVETASAAPAPQPADDFAYPARPGASAATPPGASDEAEPDAEGCGGAAPTRVDAPSDAPASDGGGGAPRAPEAASAPAAAVGLTDPKRFAGPEVGAGAAQPDLVDGMRSGIATASGILGAAPAIRPRPEPISSRQAADAEAAPPDSAPAAARRGVPPGAVSAKPSAPGTAVDDGPRRDVDPRPDAPAERGGAGDVRAARESPLPSRRDRIMEVLVHSDRAAPGGAGSGAGPADPCAAPPGPAVDSSALAETLSALAGQEWSGAAGTIIPCAVFNAAMIPGWPPPRPFDVPELSATATLAMPVPRDEEAALARLAERGGALLGQQIRAALKRASARRRRRMLAALTAVMDTIDAVLTAIEAELLLASRAQTAESDDFAAADLRRQLTA